MTEAPFPDRLSLLGMRFMGRHGANPGEQDEPQPFEVDVILHADLAPAADSDDLSATVDYDGIAEVARAVVEGASVALIETLAGSIARDVLAVTDPSLVDAVEVNVRKPDAPLDIEIDYAEASLFRRRDSGARGSVSRRASRRG